MFGETFKNFAININALNARGSFSAGDNMTGQITFELSKKTKITSVTMSLKGVAKVQWTSSSGGGRRRRRRVHTAMLDFFKLGYVVLTQNAVGHTTLQPGNHVYPFRCQIPRGNFPSSFHGVGGNIVYSLKMEIHRPWHMVKEFETEFNFASDIDANHHQLRAPMAGYNTKTLCCLWCASGPISMNIRLERKGFVPGECVKIMCALTNGSSRTVTPKATLSQKQQSFDHNRTAKRMTLKHLVTVRGTPVNAGTSEVDCEMTLTIPHTTALTISNCSILEVNYTVDVSLCVSGSSDLEVLFPIILCNVPVDDPPPY